jgi:hypothetical protein
VLVALGYVHPHEFRAAGEHRSDEREIAGVCGLHETGYVGPIDEGFELRPARKSVGTRKNALGIVECEGIFVRIQLESLYLRSGGLFAGAVVFEQIFGLLAKLFEIGMLRQTTRSGRRHNTADRHDDLLSHCPLSAVSGEKKIVVRM